MPLLVSLAAKSLGFVKKPEPCALWVDVSLIDLELMEGTGYVGSKTTYARSLGSVAVTLSLSDSLTNEVVLRYATRRALPGGQYIETHTPGWHSLERVAGEVLRDIAAETGRAVPATQSDALDYICHDALRDRTG